MTQEEWLAQARTTFFDTIISSSSLQALTDCAYSILGNPICVASANGEILSNARGETPTNDSLWEEHLSDGFISKSVKQQTERSRSIASDHGKPFIWNREMGKYRMMICYPKDKNRINLRVVMLESTHPFSELDEKIFEIFSQATCYFMRNTNLARNFDSNTDEYFLYQLVRGHIQLGKNRLGIEERLDLRNSDLYAFFIAKRTFENVKPLWLANAKNMLRELFPGSIVIICEDCLVCFILLRDHKSVSYEQLLELIQFLRKSQMHGCLGRVFDNISYITQYYCQTVDFLKLGNRLYQGNNLFFAQSMVITYLLDKLDINSIETLCYLPVLELWESDMTSGSEYLPALYAYILTFGSISAASRLMGIHYNSMKQRIIFIKKIVGCNLEKLLPSLFISIHSLYLIHPADMKKCMDLDFRHRLVLEGGS